MARKVGLKESVGVGEKGDGRRRRWFGGDGWKESEGGGEGCRL